MNKNIEFIEMCLPYWFVIGSLGFLVWFVFQIICEFAEEQNTEKEKLRRINMTHQDALSRMKRIYNNFEGSFDDFHAMAMAITALEYESRVMDIDKYVKTYKQEQRVKK